MPNQTPLAPTAPALSVTVYIVLNDFGPLGRAYVETDEAQADDATIVENILTGQYSHPLRVVAFNTAEGWSRDVTHGMAWRILELNRRGTPLGAAARDFVERITGNAPVVAV